MADIHNIFISHYSEDDEHLHRLKERLQEKGCLVRNSSVEKGDYRKDPVSDSTIAKELRGYIKWAGTVVVLIGEHTHERPWVKTMKSEMLICKARK
ncbi:TIR domain-containing protein [Segatella copri]|uniref:TIR domain-containing protein n=1 Tax=Segatella copri TaxID=165179 RepID=UPI0020CA6C1A|nr:TIR domain-containing protein [Segatella copri]